MKMKFINIERLENLFVQQFINDKSKFFTFIKRYSYHLLWHQPLFFHFLINLFYAITLQNLTLTMLSQSISYQQFLILNYPAHWQPKFFTFYKYFSLILIKRSLTINQAKNINVTKFIYFISNKFPTHLSMEKCKKVSFRQFTVYFFNDLKLRQNEVLQLIEKTDQIRSVIEVLLQGKNYASEYAEEIEQIPNCSKIFSKLFKMEKNISQSQYQQKIDEIADKVDTHFLELQDPCKDISFQVNSSNVHDSGIRNVSVNNSKIQSDKMQQDDLAFDEQLETQDTDNSVLNRRLKIGHDQNATAIPKAKPLQTEKSLIRKAKNTNATRGTAQKGLYIDKSQPIINQEDHRISKKEFKANELKVEVRYLVSSVDFEYNYNNHSLKENFEKYIRKYLTQKQIIVRRQVHEIKIMEEIEFLKSKQAGNYRFNPLCDCLEVWITLKQDKYFNNDFTIVGDMQQLIIIPKPIPTEQWNKSLMNLTPKSPIEELIKYVCEKRQAIRQVANLLTKKLKNQGGASVVQDLFGWQKNDYDNIKFKTTYIHEVQQLIEKIKNSCSNNSQKQHSKDKQQCIKTANSHKILRYVVYKLNGLQGILKISWINMKNLKKAFSIVQNQIHNKQLLAQLLQYFSQFALDPEQKPLSLSRGLILYGPPGTGKTVLTEALPNIIGFHLIEKGLSAADFMKSLVGETSRMIKDLVSRAAISPYLLCSIGIDEVDGLVPDRKDKDQKNKAEGISMMLSVIGGNQDVPNLTFMTSTNYIKKIDEAIGRRLSGKFQVGRPNPEQRSKIVLEKVKYLQNKAPLLDHLVKITTNFTGAALGGIANSLRKSLKIKQMNGQQVQLTINEITTAAILIAKQFNITLGVYTLPDIYQNQGDKKFVFTETFLTRISRHLLMVKYIGNNQFDILYANQIQKFYDGVLTPVYEKERDKIHIQVEKNKDFNSFINYAKTLFDPKHYDIKEFRAQNFKTEEQCLMQIHSFLKKRQSSKRKKKTVLIIQQQSIQHSSIFLEIYLFIKNYQDLYIIGYLLPQNDMTQLGDMLFGVPNCRSRINSNRTKLGFKAPQKMAEMSSQLQNETIDFNYSGRMLVELNDDTRMVFQLKNCIQSESKVAFRLFLKSEGNTTPQTFIPQLVDFFTKQQVSYLLLIDYELLLQNDAFEQKKIMQVMEQKMLEAKNYKRSAVIIDLDSMIPLSQNASDSNMGRSVSYNIQNHNLFQILLNYMRSFATTSGGNSRWMTIIVKHPELINMVKKQLNWSKYPEETEQQNQERAMDQQRRCYRCKAYYTQRENKQQRKCMQHPGRIIDTVSKTFEQVDVKILKARNFCRKKKQNNAEENRYIYACCLKDINEQGENAYYHISEAQFQGEEDQLHTEQLQTFNDWDEVLTYFTDPQLSSE